MTLITQPIHRFPGLCGWFCLKLRHVIHNYVLWLGCYVGLRDSRKLRPNWTEELWYSSVVWRVNLIVAHVNSKTAWCLVYRQFFWVAVCCFTYQFASITYNRLNLLRLRDPVTTGAVTPNNSKLPNVTNPPPPQIFEILALQCSCWDDKKSFKSLLCRLSGLTALVNVKIIELANQSRV